jgi:ribosomal protein L40E
MLEIVIGLVILIFWLVLFFAVLDIKNNSILINKNLARMLSLMESVVPENKKPKPESEPTITMANGVTVRICPKCGSKNNLQSTKCGMCKSVLIHK